MPALLPKNEARRLAKLRGYEILDTEPERTFERIVRMTARIFDVPMAAITLVDEYRAWSKATYGFEERQSARDSSFCAHTILQQKVLIVPDAAADARFAGEMLGEARRHMRFYAGAPLRAEGGHVLGALCVMDNAPRRFSVAESETLTDLAAIVIDELSLRRVAGHLRSEVNVRKRTERTLTRQHHLLQRLSGSLEENIRQRTADLTHANDSLRAEIIRRERADAALKRAKDEAEKANAAKSDFLTRMSHELRTPLNAILGFGHILQKPMPADAQHDCAKHVVNAGRHLLSLINEVLDIARIEANKLELVLEPVRVTEVIAETLDLIRPLAAERSIIVEISPGTQAGQFVLADRQRFKQVMLNLLSNAVKYSPAGSMVRVGCRARGPRTMELSVHDDGPGIPADKAERLFVAFERLGAGQSEVQGTGLGLALSKRLVEAMDGKIGVQSAPGEGNAFWVRLPRERIEPQPVADSQMEPAT